MNRQFPRLEVDASRIRSNAQQIAARCRARGIAVCGVIKGVNGLPEIVRTYKEAGIAELGTSRASNRSFAAARPGSKGRIC